MPASDKLAELLFMTDAERPAALWAAALTAFRLALCMGFAMTFHSAFRSRARFPCRKATI